MRRMVKKAVRNAGKGITNEGINFENLYSIIDVWVDSVFIGENLHSKKNIIEF